MIRLHAIDHSNRERYADVLRQHDRLRRRLAAAGRCWSLAAASDDSGAVAGQGVDLVALAPCGQVAGGTRLMPTEGPTLLGDVFPHLADMRDAARGPGVWEWTHFVVAPRFRGDGRRCHVSGVLAVGLVEHCLARGITRMNVVTETFWVPTASELGWQPRPLGLPVERDGVSICAFTVAMTPMALRTTRALYGVADPCLWAPAHSAGRLAPRQTLHA
ncbi:acyl-homoserine-lactone synthase [Methylobacterium nodulans]|uniref:Autoinducer synthesis protein n=1 Tax=Methylobacterium nodulans (strain LMG 21967 / CNCM I-2342 / ORS 2060) TaxID=460265 RepID=B8I9S4_METNO|nr:acyl-homoserine-lactone synthase [Methylobacterium nodulans]ACL55327.1 autoinducer synthesis protein [Methylobacterium nodulans ORS 2060]